MTIKLTARDLRERIIGTQRDYETYVSPLINLANRFAQATRPNQVGQTIRVDSRMSCP